MRLHHIRTSAKVIDPTAWARLMPRLPTGGARAEGLTKQTAYRITADPRAAEAALVAWGL